MDRRSFLKSAAVTGGALALGDSFWRRLYASPAHSGESPYGPLSTTPDLNGLLLPEGATARVIARSGLPLGTTGHIWPAFPDGAYCFPKGDAGGSDGWILVVNSENPPAADFNDLEEVQDLFGGASAVHFDAEGNIESAGWILQGTRTNCAGGPTPWGTWLSCEEYDWSSTPFPFGSKASEKAGRVWECDPTGATPSTVWPLLGSFKHEGAAIDPATGIVYLTEDQGDGLLYRFMPESYSATDARIDFGLGTLQAAQRHSPDAEVSDVTWHDVGDPEALDTPTRHQVPDATVFDGGEGCWFDSGKVYITTKNDNRVWCLDTTTESDTIKVLYDDDDQDGDPVLTGVDNLIVSPGTGNIYVAEDGGNMEAVVITPTNEVAPVVRATGPQHGVASSSPIPTASEVTGLAISPDGRRLYFSSQRGFALGITYEVTLPTEGEFATTF